MVLGQRTGTILRPTLLGALVVKAAAHTVSSDPARLRHVLDFVVLTTLIDIDDIPEGELHNRDRGYLQGMVGVLDADPALWAGIEGGGVGVERLRLALAR